MYLTSITYLPRSSSLKESTCLLISFVYKTWLFKAILTQLEHIIELASLWIADRGINRAKIPHSNLKYFIDLPETPSLSMHKRGSNVSQTPSILSLYKRSLI